MAYVMRYADSPREEVTRFETIDAAMTAFAKRAGDMARFAPVLGLPPYVEAQS